MNFRLEVEQHLSEAISNFKLQLCPVDNSQIILIGKHFALTVSRDRENIEVGYVEFSSQKSFMFHRITNFIGLNRFLPADSACYGHPDNSIEAQFRASFRVVVSGLTNRCKDILEGDKSWLIELRRKDEMAWKGEPLNSRLKAVVNKYLALNK